jgi:hypothetical protein
MTGLTPPIATYTHSEGSSVTGGYVYHGSKIASLQGKYIFGDFISGTVWTLTEGIDHLWTRAVLLESGKSIGSFAEDRNGELYLLDYSIGEVFRLVEG